LLNQEKDDDTSSTGDAFAVLAQQPQQQLAAALTEVHSILAGPSIQARCLECPSATPAKLEKKDLSLLELLKEWLS
jgi:protease-4